ncbi:MAG: nucleotidyltransferase domain-containing protein [Thermoleophilaceae bacterium]|nr:nucleotidyltransferase domain-containing protein [Thermoleophilaceae bacterium]
MNGREQASLETILGDEGILFAYLFGSRASGTAHARSDADIAVMPSRPLGLLERERLVLGLVRALGVPDVDLIALDRAALEMRGRVVQEGRPIYSADEPARVAFEVRTRSEYFDFVPTLRTLERSYLARVAERGL